MKSLKHVTFLLLFLAARMSFANDVGNGGSGVALEFARLGEVIHRHLKDFASELTDLPAIDADKFKDAINTPVNVLTIEGEPKDKFGKAQTAIFDTARREIDVNLQRWNTETKDKPEVALGMAFHEYLRAMGLDEDQYKISRKYLTNGFFDDFLKRHDNVRVEVVESTRRAQRVLCILTITTAHGPRRFRGLGEYALDARYEAFQEAVRAANWVYDNSNYNDWTKSDHPAYRCIDRSAGENGEDVVDQRNAAFIRAAARNDESTLRRLLAAGVSTNVVYEGHTAITAAIAAGAPDTFGVMLNQRSVDLTIVVGSSQEGYRTALQWALSAKQAAFVQALLDSKKDLNVNASRSTPALTHAASAGELKVVEALLALGARVDLDNELMFLAQDNVLSVLAKAGAKLEEMDRNGRTLLVRALEDNQLQRAEILLAAGAKHDVKVRRNSQAKVPLVWEIVTEASAPKLALLKKYGANLDVTEDASGKDDTGLSYLIRFDGPVGLENARQMVSKLRILLPLGVNVNHRTYDDETPLKMLRKNMSRELDHYNKETEAYRWLKRAEKLLIDAGARE